MTTSVFKVNALHLILEGYHTIALEVNILHIYFLFILRQSLGETYLSPKDQMLSISSLASASALQYGSKSRPFAGGPRYTSAKPSLTISIFTIFPPTNTTPRIRPFGVYGLT